MKTTLGALACLTLLTGCSSDIVDVAPAASGSGADGPAFSPCDDIPDDAVRALGMDPETETREIEGVTQPGWDMCMWNSGGQFLTVLATTRTMGELRADPEYTSFLSTNVGGRSVLRFADSDTQQAYCYTATATEGGSVIFRARDSAAGSAADTCATAFRFATALVPFTPN